MTYLNLTTPEISFFDRQIVDFTHFNPPFSGTWYPKPYDFR